MKSPVKPIFIFSICCLALAAGLFWIKGIDLNVFHLKPLIGSTPTSVENPVPEPGLNKQIVITNADLQNLIVASASDYLQNPTVQINVSDVSASANIIKVVKTQADLTIKIDFTNNKVSAQILELKTASLGAPGWLKSTLTDLINKKIDEEVNDKYQIKTVSQQTGKIIININ